MDAALGLRHLIVHAGFTRTPELVNARLAEENEVAIGGDDFVSITRQRELKQSGFDITPHIAGAYWLEIRFTAANALPHEILSLVGFGVQGQVRKKR